MAQMDSEKHKELIKNPLGGECSDCGCDGDSKCGHCPLNPNVGCGITPYPPSYEEKARCYCCNRVLGIKQIKKTGRVM